jgi:DNA repair exonuclease SbcCD ATPase subunit
MTVDVTSAEVSQEQKISDKELNFRALESKFQRQVEQINQEKERLARELEEVKRLRNSRNDEEDDDSEPYVDKKRLEKKLKSFERDLDEKIDRKAEEKAQRLLEKREQENWLEQNPDFYDVVQGHAQRFFEKAPRLAEAILKMPDNFERKKLVYHNIKSLGIDRPEVKPSSIQEKVDANRRSPYYQPSGVGSAPYAQVGDFSEAGKKQAWEQVQKLKANLRLGG